MLQVGIVLGEFFGLFLLSRRVIQSLFNLFLIISNRPIAISLVSTLLFPGTVIHELSHLFTAEVLGVHTGKLTLIPESIDKENIHAGTVEIARTDPIRRYIIGLAPILIGLPVLCVISYLLPHFFRETTRALESGNVFSELNLYFLIGAYYLFFILSNTMFSSREDLHGIGPFLIVIALVAVAAYVSGIRLSLTGNMLTASGQILTILTRTLAGVILVNLIMFILLTLATTLFGKLLKRKIIHT